MMWVLLNSAALRESCCGRAEGAGAEKTSRARSQVEKDPDHDPTGLLSQYIMVSPVFCFFSPGSFFASPCLSWRSIVYTCFCPMIDEPFPLRREILSKEEVAQSHQGRSCQMDLHTLFQKVAQNSIRLMQTGLSSQASHEPLPASSVLIMVSSDAFKRG